MRRHAVFTIAGWEMKGAARSRWVVVGALLYTAAAVAMALVNLRSMSVLGLRGAGAVVDGLIALGLILPPLFGIVLGAGVIAGAREQGSLAMIASQPVERSTIVWGSFTGMVLTVWSAVGIGLGLVAVITAPVITSGDLAGLGMAVVVTLAAGAAGVALGVFVSARSPGRGQATAIAVAIWFLVALGIDIVLVAVAPVNLGPVGLLVVTLLNPMALLRTLGLMAIDPSALGPFGNFLDDRFGLAGSAVLLTVALASWLVAPLLTAAANLRRRDI